jgi:hypothetical protein
MKQSLFSRRTFITSAFLALPACGENGIGRNLVTAFQLATVGLPGPTITRATVDSIPYASIAARIGKGPRSLLVLWEQTAEGLLWLSADGVGITTHRGRIVKTVGLENNLRRTVSLRGDPIGSPLLAANTSTRLLDLEPDGPFELAVESQYRIVGRRTISVTEIDFDTVLIIEDCRAKTLNWEFSNRYWADPADGFIWRSEQFVLPSLPVFEIEVLKPAAA